MSIALATRGVISGFMGAGGEVVYVEVPVADIDPSASEVGSLSVHAMDTSRVASAPVAVRDVLPHRISEVEIKPTRNRFPAPRNI